MEGTDRMSCAHTVHWFHFRLGEAAKKKIFFYGRAIKTGALNGFSSFKSMKYRVHTTVEFKKGEHEY